MKEYKVYGGLIMVKGKQRRTIIATRTKKRAVELLTPFTIISASHFRDYWGETGNKIELSVALAEPEVVFISNDDQSDSNKTYVKLEK